MRNFPSLVKVIWMSVSAPERTVVQVTLVPFLGETSSGQWTVMVVPVWSWTKDAILDSRSLWLTLSPQADSATERSAAADSNRAGDAALWLKRRPRRRPRRRGGAAAAARPARRASRAGGRRAS